MRPYAAALGAFNETLGTEYQPTPEVAAETDGLLKFAGVVGHPPKAKTTQILRTEINYKFRLNLRALKALFAACAKAKITLNYHDKSVITNAIDASDDDGVLARLKARSGLTSDALAPLARLAQPISASETFARFHAELKSPTLARKDSKPRDWSGEILEGLFCAFVCRLVGSEKLHAYNAPLDSSKSYEPHFWTYLQSEFPNLHSGKPSLIVLKPHAESSTSDLLNKSARAYSELSGYGYLAVVLDRAEFETDGALWRTYAKLAVFAQRHVVRRPANSFFRPHLIAQQTIDHVPTIDLEAADFSAWQDGFYYQDCFFIDDSSPKLLVLLEKREADENPIPCPSCRSLKVQGNSYPSLGIKSWECCNILCPDKSKFGRGKRYSFVQLLKQAAIEEPGNGISPDSVKRWLRDVQPVRTDSDILAMLVSHYSLAGDTVLLDGFHSDSKSITGRSLVEVVLETEAMNSASIISVEDFPRSPFFCRFLVDAQQSPISDIRGTRKGSLWAIHGEAQTALRGVDANVVDGAVTSPPYYNAREYSQWANIYTYLFDMFCVNKEVYRVLKPGAYYLYNIFDYFDNENDVVQSAMGEKRLTLGAYTEEMFERIGFECLGNIVWDKGAIEGKRGFNGGNFSPYYQAPFNCWEHILVFRKPGDSPAIEFPRVFRQGAVIKMVGGENRYGHTAPFPEGIPELLISRLQPGSTVLDPFSGSMTTALVASRYDCGSICVERSDAYFQLGLQRFQRGTDRGDLF